MSESVICSGCGLRQVVEWTVKKEFNNDGCDAWILSIPFIVLAENTSAERIYAFILVDLRSPNSDSIVTSNASNPVICYGLVWFKNY